MIQLFCIYAAFHTIFNAQRMQWTTF